MKHMLPDSLRQAILTDASAIADEEIKSAQERVQTRVRARVAQLAATVIEQISIEKDQDNLVITLKFDGARRG
ncbi:hypothetical protein [Ferrovibrio terrae]|uniref:hypothetical protein n=1 Tax=Ferrovibrio terrae TaxID=2594003 RepID=UPI003138361F